MKAKILVVSLAISGTLFGCATPTDYVTSNSPEAVCKNLSGQWDRGRQQKAVTIQSSWNDRGCSIIVRAQNPIDKSDNTTTVQTTTPETFRYRASNVGGGFDSVTVQSATQIAVLYRNGTGFSGSTNLRKLGN